MFKKLIDKIKNNMSYYKNPRYIIIKGVGNGNRRIFILGARPLTISHQYYKMVEIHGYDTDDHLRMSFQNQDDMTWFKSNKYKTIWTFKELIFWRRLLPNNGFKCLEYKKGKWCKITDEK